MIKAVFFDIDGTLLSPNGGVLPESTRKALAQLKKQGIKIYVASGRHLCEIQDLPIHDIEFDGYVCLNGQLGFGKDKQLLFSNPISSKDIQSFERLFNEKKIPMVFVEEDRLYLNFANEYVKIAQKAIATDIPPIDIYQGNPIYQVTAFSDDIQTQEIMSHLSSCRMTRWNSYGVDIISNQGSKAMGIQSILKIHHIDPSEVMAFGDGENDKEMLEFSQIGIAMGNAEEEIKQIADYVTGLVDEDGILKALIEMNLIRDEENI